MTNASASPPGVAELSAPLLARIPEADVPLFLALAERLAAARYRTWATATTDEQIRATLLACADREEDIARRVEGLVDNAAMIQQTIAREIPELAELVRVAFDGRSLRQQFALQAEGERLGATTWRSLAGKAESAGARDTLSGCAELEEQSAQVLEALLTDGTWPFNAA